MSVENDDRWSGSAVFSECGVYRYSLTRVRNAGSGTCAFVMLNPSTADATHNDPTIRRCMGFAQSWGYRRLEVVNLFALRSTDPKALVKANDPIGEENDSYIVDALSNAELTVAAWGDHGALESRSRSVMELIAGIGTSSSVLGLNRSGQPTHPLYLPASTQPKTLIA